MIILCGKTCSGKNTIMDEIIKRTNFRQIVTYTTRPKRKGEIDNKTYHFIEPELFNNLEKINFFFETTSYNVANGETWKYGTSIDSLHEDGIIISNPDGLSKLKKLNKFNPVVFYLWADDVTLRNRLIARGDNKDEANRRLKKDYDDFCNIESMVDYVIPNCSNNNIESTINSILTHLQIKEDWRKNMDECN